jgi:hypothetical protein
MGIIERAALEWYCNGIYLWQGNYDTDVVQPAFQFYK